MTPLEALEAELCSEARALARRLNAGQMPDAITVRVVFNRETGMPRDVEVNEERKRRIIEGPARAKRCESAA